MFPFADEVCHDPVFFAHLKILLLKTDEFGSPKAAADEQREDGPIALRTNRSGIAGSQKTLRLL